MKNLFIKVSVVFLFCAMFSIAVNAQNTFNKGDKVIGAGLGVGSTWSGYGSAIPIFANFEMGIKDNLFDDKSSIGVGGYFGFASSKGLTCLFPGVRGALHYQFVDKLDTYAGLMIGLRFWSWKNNYYYYGNASGTDLILPFFIGARYYFQDNLAGFAELGYGVAALHLGIAYKF